METLTINVLAESAGVSTRTIRYYIAQGLLPPPKGGGRGAAYTEMHLGYLNRIRELQAEHLPLAEIRHQLEELSDRELTRLSRKGAQLARETATVVADDASDSDDSDDERGSSRRLSTIDFPQSNWQRLQVSDNIEIHVRRPLSREANRKLADLLTEARRLFPDE